MAHPQISYAPRCVPRQAQATGHRSMQNYVAGTGSPTVWNRLLSEKDENIQFSHDSYHWIKFSYLKNYDKEQQADCNVNLKSSNYHTASSQLSKEICQNKYGSQKLATAPAHVHVLSLLIPLEIHTQAILEECCNKTEPCNSWQDMFAALDNLISGKKW